MRTSLGLAMPFLVRATADRAAFAVLAPAALLHDVACSCSRFLLPRWFPVAAGRFALSLAFIATFYVAAGWRAYAAVQQAFVAMPLPHATGMAVSISVGGPLHELLCNLAKTGYCAVLICLGVGLRLGHAVLGVLLFDPWLILAAMAFAWAMLELERPAGLGPGGGKRCHVQ